MKPVSPFSNREVFPFNHKWRFARYGTMPDGTDRIEPDGSESGMINDTTWRELSLPHDWGIEGPFRPDLPGETGKLPWIGIGWYRKHFYSPDSDNGKRVFIDFDGAMSHAKVWLNGKFIGEWPYGYNSFRLELTPQLSIGAENLLAVRLYNPPESSRWYPGAGIYRNVSLVKTTPIHVAHWGTFVTTPEISEKNATVRIDTELENSSGRAVSVVVKHEIFEDEISPRKVAEQIAFSGMLATGNQMIPNCSVVLKNFNRWDIESPNLYYVQTSVVQDGASVDSYRTGFGIRTIDFSADKGFLLNGRPLKIKGVCLHHDLGPLGAAVNRRAIERQLEIMKEMGCNAIRTSHNPPTPELLDLCDRMGLLVQAEAFDCWATGKKENDYRTLFTEWHERDLLAMIRRDRNHPSIFMWSTGNEVREQWPNWLNSKLSRHLTEIVHREDPTRPASVGCNCPDAGFNGFQKTMDVFGYNYNSNLYGKFIGENPDIPLYGSETASCISSRGEYFFPVEDNISKGCGGYFQVSSYDLSAPMWATTPDTEFEMLERVPSLFGEFVWTGFDYLGEPTPYNQDRTNLLNFSDPEERAKMAKEMERLGANIPPRSSYFGIVDLCGFKKDRFYIYQAHWRPELPMAHILPHWNWPERIGQITPVHVYTSGNEAELFLNGKSLGRKTRQPYQYRLRWDDVIYDPGELRVVAYKGGEKWAEETMRTTGPAVAVKLAADRQVIQADGADLSFVTVSIADANELTIPRSHNLVRFSISGSGEIIAVGNGNPVSHEPFQAQEHKVFNGLCLVIIRSQGGQSGAIVLNAESEGLMPTSIDIRSH